MTEKKFASRAGRMKASEIRELLKLLDRPDIISFAGGIPDAKIFPAQDFAEAYSEALSGGAAGLQYSTSEGHKPLRAWICEQMGKIGVPCDLDNIMITSGSQQALDYLGKLFLSPNDTALVSWPTYMGALGAFNAYEPNYDRLSRLGNRSAEQYREAAAENNGVVKFAYMSPDFSNPTGETMDRAERLRILDLADALDISVIEDGAYQSLRYTGEAIEPILALDIQRSGSIENTRTIYSGSFSKTLSPGLRIGWVCASKDIISRLVILKQAGDLHTSTVNQMAMDIVARKIFDKQVEKARTVYGARLGYMLAALAREMPEGVTWTEPEGGMFVWVTLPEKMDGASLLAHSLETEKVAFVPGKAFYADGSNANTIRLSFSCADEAMINEGIARLARVIKAEQA